MTQKLVVIGNGMVGARFVEELVRRHGNDFYSITMFGEEPYGNYNRILLSHVLAGVDTFDTISIQPLDWYSANGIQLLTGQRVTMIDPVRRVVRSDQGYEAHYDQLVLATGSRPFIPPLDNLYAAPSQFKPGIFVFRTLDDCRTMLDFAAGARRAIVLGGGLLGLETARGLLARGLEVHIVHASPVLMNAQLDESASAILLTTLQRLGLHVHLERHTIAALGEQHFTGLAFRDGSTLDGDMLVISTGIRPNTELAIQAGLTVERGILVDDTLATSDPAIFAIGECAQHRGKTYGIVAPLWEQARVLAERLTHAHTLAHTSANTLTSTSTDTPSHTPANISANTLSNTSANISTDTLHSTSPNILTHMLYKGSSLSTRLKVMDIELLVLGEDWRVRAKDEVLSYAEPEKGIYKKILIRENRLENAILLGDCSGAARLQHYFERKQPLPENRAELLISLFNLGALNSGLSLDPAQELAELPDDAQICNCNGVTKGTIIAAVKAGKRSLPMLTAATRAGTGCGSCKGQVQVLLELAAGSELIEDPSIHYYVPGVPLRKPELVQAIKEQQLRSVSAVFKALANGKEDPQSKAGLASLLKIIWGKEYEDERDARFINDRVHANIQNNGTFSVVPRIYGGITSPQELRRIADVAEKYQVPMVKLTGGQRIDLLGVRKEHLPAVWRELGMPSGHAYTKAFRTCKTCVGSEFCRFGLGDSTALGVKIEQRFQGIESPHKLKLAVSGCPRNCAESTTKDIGVVAIEGGQWEIYIGGAAGSRVRKGDLLCTVNTHDEALQLIGRFMQYYREHARYQERTYAFVERIGIERIRQLLLEDVEGIATQLDQAIQEAVDAYRDPWQEAERPVTANQFAEVLAYTE
ncbi:nitrite reductase (NADH) large subunit [Thermosporothrix hazakensis]|jgi:nitrite reductase (NADH) large subunit|uniref:Nitrite reductase (NADH) large subunit n=2 Tax=Thermosporothrix TaxID=768650 RepID=A0A326UDF4_THEHA|nr:NAD(P)/FAD-dependent oxidoreductase [Thermosporothrix hazakensis]PZW32764.1 nitrite reductase (NADH) large subunit [Thermosporothrix hazakensis]BBH87679.1 nitrite reductase [NAD(P)H] [Thermosporothrix sp. COM3]GCE50121.1 nitrite reductase [NAD(P)H] [Thermosporothrix hazakensis]